MTQRSSTGFNTLFVALGLMALSVMIRPAMATTLTVTNLNDAGAGSLRATVAAAVATDTIVFTPTGTIVLTSPISIAAPITISGPGANLLAISGNNVTRIFNVSSTVTISGLTLQNGLANSVALRGGAISNTGSLTLDGVALKANVAFDGGGAIYNESVSGTTGQLKIKNSQLSGNSVSDFAGIGGGAILSTSLVGTAASVTILDSTITGNTANTGALGMTGGGIYYANGALKLVSSTVSGNNAGIAGGDIHQASVANTTLSLRNSIVSGGVIAAAGYTPDDIDIFQPLTAPIASLGYNIVTNRSAGTPYALTDAANGTNPLLGAFAANGGPTQTLLPGATSPALAFVPLASCVDDLDAALTRDQRGVLRQAGGATTCDAGATESIRLAAVQSRKRHGAFDRDLVVDRTAPINGNLTVEPRSIGAGHQIVFQFTGPIGQPGTANILNSSLVSLGSATAVVNPSNNNEILITLAGVADNKRGTVTSINPGGSGLAFPVSMGFLVGDVNSSRAVNASDISGVKARSGVAVDNANSKFDVNVSGVIDLADVSAVKARSGLVLTP